MPVKDSAEYRAPALEKGLDILELLAAEAAGLGQNEIARRLGRSVPEIFRMVSCLAQRGYLNRDEASGRYRVSLRLFELAHRHPPMERLLTLALPLMHEYAREAGQSAHLAVHFDGRILVVAKAEGSDPMAFSVRLGAHFPFRADRTSARVLTAFQSSERHQTYLDMLTRGVTGAARVKLLKRLALIRRRGHERAPSDTVRGVIDMSYPVFDHGGVIAGLTSPYLEQRDNRRSVVEACRMLGVAAERLSRELGAPSRS